MPSPECCSMQMNTDKYPSYFKLDSTEELQAQFPKMNLRSYV